MPVVTSFRDMLNTVPPMLVELTPEKASRRTNSDDWSPKQELGHLLDSAIMNHQRLLRVLAEDNPTLSGYDGPFCVTAHDYHARDWNELIATWKTLNTHFLWAIERVSDLDWRRPCISEGKSMTLEFLVTDYIHHALHHLREMGINVERVSASVA